jgi:hypothetical protein
MSPKMHSSFLKSPDARNEFDEGLRFPRRVTEAGATPNPSAQKLDEIVAQKLRNFRKTEHKRFIALGIAVNPSDGMTWSAESISRLVHDDFPELTIIRLVGEASTDRLPEIASLYRDRKFGRIAHRHQITDAFGLSKWRSGLVCLGLLLVGFGASIVSEFPFEPGAEVTPTLLFLSGIASLLGVGGHYLVASTGRQNNQEAIRALTTDFHSANAKAREGELADFLASQLTRMKTPRCVIVDGFEKLDSLTKETIRYYFAGRARQTEGFELWVVFENGLLKEFHNLTTINKEKFGFQRSTLFHQVTLPESERAVLKQGRPGPLYHAVGLLTRSSDESSMSFNDFLDGYLAAHGGANDVLKFLYFLAVNAVVGGNPPLTSRFIEDKLTELQRVRSELLPVVLPGIPLRRASFHRLMATIETEFAEFLEMSQDGALNDFRLIPECALTLVQRWHDYELPDPEVVNIFWALFWYDWLQQHAEGYWINKTSAHLQACNAASFRGLQRSAARVEKSLFDACLFVIKGCLSACILHTVSDLLTMASALTEAEEEGERRRRVSRLLGLAWEAYALLGDDAILEDILFLDRPEQGRQPHTSDAKKLEMLFMESLRLERVSRERELTFSRLQALPTIRSYALIRGAWIASTLRPLTKSELDDLPLMGGAAGAASLRLPALVDEVLSRVLDAREAPYATDLLGLSLGLWSMTLNFLEGEISVEKSVDLFTDESGSLADTESLIASISPKWNEQAVSIVGALETAVLLADSKLSDRPETISAFDFVQEGLGKEVLVIAAACCVMLSKKFEPLLSEEVKTRMEDAFRIANGALSSATESRLNRRSGRVDRGQIVVRHLNLLKVAWRALGLTHLSATLDLIGAHIKSLQATSDSDIDTSRDLLTNLGTKEAGNHIGLLAYAIATLGAKRSGDEAAALIVQGVDTASKSLLGGLLMQELALLAIKKAHSYNANLDPFLVVLTDQERSGVTLAQLLENIPDSALDSVALWLTNLAGVTKLPGMVTVLIETLRNRADSSVDSEAAEQVHQRVDSFELRQKLKAGDQVDACREIEGWKKRNQPLFTWVLHLFHLYLYSRHTPEVLQESVSVFRRTYDGVPSSGYFYLALDVLEDCWIGLFDAEATSEAEALALAFLKKHHPAWLRSLPTETNIQILQILVSQQDEDRERYLRQLVEQESIRLARDEVKKLPLLIQRGHYFAVLMHYFKVLSFWGLPSDVTPRELSDRGKAPPEEKLRLLLDWQKRVRDLPAPFSAGSVRLSSDFLEFGQYLFSPPADTLQEFDELRTLFDRAAAQGLKVLYTRVATLESIPIQIRSIIQRHSQTLVNVAKPI